ELRRMVRNGLEQEAGEVTGHLAQVVSRLRTNYIVIEPTAIDEYRFSADSEGQLMGNLDARWPFHRDTRDLLYLKPAPWGTSAARAGFPVDWDSDSREPLAGSSVLRELQEAIEHQIDARDHALVEQAQRIACYRPLYNGNASKGVREELEHLGRL